MNDPMDYEVRNEEIETLLKDIGHIVKNACSKHGYLFALHIFSAGEGGDMFYISSANRADYINAMKEFIEKFGAN